MAQTPKQKAAFKKARAVRAANIAKKNAAAGLSRTRSSDAQVKAARKAARKGRKPSAKTIAAMRAGAKKYWRDRKGSGTAKSHIPLKQLRKNRDGLSKLIKEREKNPAIWK